MRIWLIEGHSTRSPLGRVLDTGGHQVESFAPADAARTTRESEMRPDVIMVHWNGESGELSEEERGRRNGQGLGVIRELRRRADRTPIMLYATADCPDWEVALALDAGADDFIAGPLTHPAELLGRLRALRRRTSGLVCIEVLRCGPISIDLAHRRVEVDGRVVALGALEYGLLVYLAERAGQHVSTEELLEALFEAPGNRARGPERTRAPAMVVSRLRRKLGHARTHLATIVGFGFMLASVPVASSSDTSLVGPRRETS